MKLHPKTRAIHSSDLHDANAAAVATPIYLSTTFEREADGTIGKYLYSRYSNPNRDLFEKALCDLEGGFCAMAFASGLAATNAVLQTLKSGERVLIPDDAYYGLRSQLVEIFASFGVSFELVDMCNHDAIRAALKTPTTLVWIETPSNPALKITDIKAVAEMAHQAGARVICDNTWATPILQHPIELGCDMVLHSVTKYIGGHSDVLMGAVVYAHDDEQCRLLRRVQMVGGAVPSPFECYLAARGLQTLDLRVRAACNAAARIAKHFDGHPAIEAVLYPGLSTHPSYELASHQMLLPGGMLSLLVRADEAQSLAVAAATRLFKHATSLGSVESLIEHRKSVEPADSLTPGNLLRLSIGLEHVEDLIADLEQALKSIA